MYILKNAIKSITRSKGRNILIAVIISIISASACIALAIESSAKDIVKSYEESFDITASLAIDRDKIRSLYMSEQGEPGSMREVMDSIEMPNLDAIANYADSDLVRSFTYTVSASMDSAGLLPLTNDEVVPEEVKGSSPGQTDRGDFTLIGYSSTDAMTGFIRGDRKIIEGEMFLDDETDLGCIISDELAAYNELSVGDTIDFEDHTLTISGIFKDLSTDGSEMNWFSNSANQILSSFETVQMVTGDEGQISATFYLYDVSDLEKLETQMQSKGLDELYMLTTNGSELEQTLRPLNNLTDFSGMFLMIVLFIGAVILLVINMINVRERRYEIGVLRAIGMKKWKVAVQFISELAIVSVMSLVIGTFAGAVASVPAAQYMLQNEIESIQEEQAGIDENFGRPGGRGGGRELLGGQFDPGADVDYVSKIDAVISFDVVLKLILIAVGLTMAAGAVSLVLISRYEPLRILSGRSS